MTQHGSEKKNDLRFGKPSLSERQNIINCISLQGQQKKKKKRLSLKRVFNLMEKTSKERVVGSRHQLHSNWKQGTAFVRLVNHWNKWYNICVWSASLAQTL